MTDSDKTPAPDAVRGESGQIMSRRAWIALGAVCIASFLGHLALFPQLPEMVPTHWNTAGDVNGWSDRLSTLGLDLLPLGLLVMFRVLPAIDPRGRAYQRMGGFYTGFVTIFTLFMVAMTWTTELVVFGILPQTGSPIGALAGVSVGIGLVLLGNYLPKVKRNYTFGCKTPWALDSDQNWRLTHRFGGVAMVAAGVATAVSGVFSRQLGGIATGILLAGVIGASLATYAYSYLVYRNGNKPLRSR